MLFEEHAAKTLLAAAGITVPTSQLVSTASEAVDAVRRIGTCVIKAQVPTGKRGKSGGIVTVDQSSAVHDVADQLLGMDIAGYRANTLLVEARVSVATELYTAIVNDQRTQGPLLLFSSRGGIDIEETIEAFPDDLARLPIDIRKGIDNASLEALVTPSVPAAALAPVCDALQQLYQAYVDNDAELLEINPLAITDDNAVVALDCKFTLDDSALVRQTELNRKGRPEPLTALEVRGQSLGLRFIEFDGSVGVLANGAGLTMTTMDAVRHYGGQPANFLEIGGEAYTLGEAALELVLSHPNVKSLLVNLCGAFARTDVMTDGIVTAWQARKPTLPVFFTIHGTGEDAAVAMVRERLALEPYDLMDDAVKAAVVAAQ
ncbi:MAG: ATP-grasp domain-containing protein [Pseudomonadota bacterium]|nr:ATP-grasp domain-containing protein [Pseudomonadota bacterium]